MTLLLIQDITGRDRGFHVGADLLTTTVDGIDLNNVWDEFQVALNLLNTSRDPLLQLFTFETTDSAQALPLDGTNMDFEIASEFGVPKSGRANPNTFIAGYPLEWYDLALRFTAKYLRDASSAEVTSQGVAAIEASNRLHFREALRALTVPATLGFRETNENGAQIYSLYAGSSDDAPPSFGGRSFPAGHTHYLVSGAATVDGQDLEDAIETITHHGHGINESERIVLLVHPNQAKTIRGFRAGVAGSPYDFIPSEAAAAYLSTEVVVGDMAPATFAGNPIIGSFGKALIVESYYAFDGYVVAIAVAGTNSPRNALAMRSHVRPDLKGLTMVPGENSRYPLVNSYYQIGVGMGVRNRGAAAVVQIKASGAYTPPLVP